MLALTLMAWLWYAFDSQRVAWSDYMNWHRGGLLILLLVATSVVVYWTSRLWLEDLPAVESDWESAWRGGVVGLADLGLSLRDLPLFLLVGSVDIAEQRRMMQAGKQKLLLDSNVIGNAPLSWFVSEKAIYLFCSSGGVLGKTLSRLRTLGIEHVNPISAHRLAADLANSAEDGDRQSIESEVGDTTVQTLPAANHQERSQKLGAGSDQGTVLATAQASEARSIYSGGVAASMESTLIGVEQLLDEHLRIDTAGRTLRKSPFGLDELIDDPLTSMEVVQCQQNLFDLALRLRGARRPVATVNGIGLVVDMTTTLQSTQAARRVGLAMRRDLAQLTETAGVNVPISVIFSGVERQAGFTEAIRRLGPTESGRRLLGSRCDPQAIMDAGALTSMVDTAAKSVSNLIYELLQDSSALATPGNHCLTKLLIALRGSVRHNMQLLIREAFADRTPQVKVANFVSGIFFAASGDGGIEKAFTQAIFGRMESQQQLLEWTAQEKQSQSRNRWLNGILVAACAAGVIGIVWQLMR
jgi:hypothetical protein